jgi:hypothetical protein
MIESVLIVEISHTLIQALSFKTIFIAMTVALMDMENKDVRIYDSNSNTVFTICSDHGLPSHIGLQNRNEKINLTSI